MRIFSLLLAFLTFTLVSYGQSVKKYSGKYHNGEATYYYFENSDFERVREGTFVYVEKLHNGESELKGEFKNGFREGNWNYYREQKDGYSDDILITEISAKFNGGNLDGECVYKEYFKGSKVELKFCSANYKENRLIGSFIYREPSHRESPVVSLLIDNNGFVTDTVKISFVRNSERYMQYFVYTGGFLTWELGRNLSTGKIFEKNAYSQKDYQYLLKKFNSSENALIYWDYDNPKIDISRFSIIYDNGDVKNIERVFYSSELESVDKSSFLRRYPLTYVREPIPHDGKMFSDIYSPRNVWNFWEINKDQTIYQKNGDFYLDFHGCNLTSKERIGREVAINNSDILKYKAEKNVEYADSVLITDLTSYSDNEFRKVLFNMSSYYEKGIGKVEGVDDKISYCNKVHDVVFNYKGNFKFNSYSYVRSAYDLVSSELVRSIKTSTLNSKEDVDFLFSLFTRLEASSTDELKSLNKTIKKIEDTKELKTIFSSYLK